jgi:hypothetical protein
VRHAASFIGADETVVDIINAPGIGAASAQARIISAGSPNAQTKVGDGIDLRRTWLHG